MIKHVYAKSGITKEGTNRIGTIGLLHAKIILLI